MKWTPEEKKQAFDEYRKNAGIVPHGKQVAEATTSAGTSRSDTRQSVAYATKPTHNPNVAVQQENDNGDKDSNSDTQMHDATAEELKSSTRPSKNSQHTGVTKKVAWAEQNGTRMNDPAKGVNKTTK